jgi:uncharacterized protein YjbJ (UPF0337 family)
VNQTVLAGNWKQIRGILREQWGRITYDDLDVIAGRREQLVGRIQERYGRSLSEAQHEVDNFSVRMARRFSGS